MTKRPQQPKSLPAPSASLRRNVVLRRSTRQIIALVSDTHGGSKFALLNPETRLTDPDTGGTLQPALNALQENLWAWYIADVGEVVRLADTSPITLAHLGDPTQGNKFGREMVASSVADHVQIALANLEPWFQSKKVRRFRQIVGTGVHEFNEGSASVLVTNTLRDRHAGVDSRVMYHALDQFGGVSFDLAHHGPGPGARNWLRGNVLRLYTQSLMRDCLDMGQTPPDFLVRGHYHQYTSEVATVRDHETRAIILPSWQYPYEHARKAAQSPAFVTFGMVAVEIENGRALGRPYRFKRTIDHRTKEVLDE